MKTRIAFISIGSAGTLGHAMLIKNVANILAKKIDEIFIIAEYDIENYVSKMPASIHWVHVKLQPSQKSNAGKLNHGSSEEIINTLEKEKITHIIFSTFFDPKILAYAYQRRIKRYLMSYLSGDSFTELFFLRGYNHLFDKVFILDDIIAYLFDK